MIAIVDYKAGNLTSVELAIKKLGETCVITFNRDVILNSKRVIFPGVGAAGAAMNHIRQLNLTEILGEFIQSGKPFLGICLGAQIILQNSEENYNTSCMGFISGSTKGFKSNHAHSFKVPHMGWNQVHFKRTHPILSGIPSESDFYFVHSYYPVPTNDEDTLGVTSYGNVDFTSIVGRNNIVACQFHAEKSGPVGLQLLKNFLEWEPEG